MTLILLWICFFPSLWLVIIIYKKSLQYRNSRYYRRNLWTPGQFVIYRAPVQFFKFDPTVSLSKDDKALLNVNPITIQMD